MNNQLHAGGKKAHQKELIKQLSKDLADHAELDKSNSENKGVLKAILARFKRMLKQSDDSLYLHR